MSTEPYFQFPLCALSFGASEDERLNAILDFCVVDAGTRLFNKLPAEERGALAYLWNQHGEIPLGNVEAEALHHAAIYGAIKLRVKYEQPGWPLQRYRKLKDHIARFELRHGRDAKVRIKSSWLFDARDGRGLSCREFAVLCGIYSVIGDKELAVVTRGRVRRCALGYRKVSIMEAELRHRADKAQPLTERQLRDTIERLHRNKFFARCTVARRITYYSIRIDNESFRKKILERRTYPDHFRATQAAQDQALTAAIKQRRLEAARHAQTQIHAAK